MRPSTHGTSTAKWVSRAFWSGKPIRLNEAGAGSVCPHRLHRRHLHALVVGGEIAALVAGTTTESGRRGEGRRDRHRAFRELDEAAVEQVPGRDAEHEDRGGDVAGRDGVDELGLRHRIERTSKTFVTSIRMVSGLKAEPTGFCIQPLAIRIQRAGSWSRRTLRSRGQVADLRACPSRRRTGRRRSIRGRRPSGLRWPESAKICRRHSGCRLQFMPNWNSMVRPVATPTRS